MGVTIPPTGFKPQALSKRCPEPNFGYPPYFYYTPNIYKSQIFLNCLLICCVKSRILLFVVRCLSPVSGVSWFRPRPPRSRRKRPWRCDPPSPLRRTNAKDYVDRCFVRFAQNNLLYGRGETCRYAATRHHLTIGCAAPQT